MFVEGGESDEKCRINLYNCLLTNIHLQSGMLYQKSKYLLSYLNTKIEHVHRLLLCLYKSKSFMYHLQKDINPSPFPQGAYPIFSTPYYSLSLSFPQALYSYCKHCRDLDCRGCWHAPQTSKLPRNSEWV